MPSLTVKAILIAAATGSILNAAPVNAGPSRVELLAGQHSRSEHRPARARDTHRRGYQYDRDHNRDHNRNRNHYRDYNHDHNRDRNARPYRKSRHHGGHDDQYHYANARRYAANAVRQARRARHFGYYPDHPRWSLNFQRHFEWALRTNTYKLEREYRKRARKLRELQRHDNYRYGYGY